MVESMPITSIADELNSWYDINCSHGDQTWSDLAELSKVSVSQICKIAKGQVLKPKFQTVKALLEAIHPDNLRLVHSYLAAQFPKHQVRLQSLIDVKRSQIAASDRHLFKDRMTFRIFKLATCKCYTVAQLEAEFGRNQVKPRIAALLASNLIEFSNSDPSSGVVCRSKAYEETTSSNVAAVAEEFHHAIDIIANKKTVEQYADSGLDHLVNRLAFFHDSFSPEALAEMSQETQEFFDRLITKYSADKYRGAIPAFLNLSTGRFDNK